MYKKNNDQKRILFVINNMRIGGTRKSLINMLSIFPYDKMDVDLLLLSPVGEYLNLVDARVNLVKTPYLCRCAFSKTKELRLQDILIKAMISLLRRIFGYETIFTLIYTWVAERLCRDVAYDAVFGFQEGESNDCASFIPSPKHYLWIHNNYEYFIGNSKGLKRSYILADKILFVAEASLQSFKKLNLGYTNKLMIIKNILPQKNIVNEATEKILDEDVFLRDVLNFISIGRLSHQKGFDRAIEVAYRLKQEGYKFRWVIIGDGEDKDNLLKSINDKKLSEFILLIGARKNPYPYIKKADVYIMTSYYESQPMALMEALTIGTPVISTKFDSVNEIIQNRAFAMIVDNTVDGIQAGTISVFNRKILDKMRRHVDDFKYNNEKIIGEILLLINEGENNERGF